MRVWGVCEEIVLSAVGIGIGIGILGLGLWDNEVRAGKIKR
jgi:hypothetical protein